MLITTLTGFPFSIASFNNHSAAFYFFLIMLQIFYCLAIFFLSWHTYTMRIISVLFIGLSFLVTGWFELLYLFFYLELLPFFAFPQPMVIVFLKFFSALPLVFAVIFVWFLGDRKGKYSTRYVALACTVIIAILLVFSLYWDYSKRFFGKNLGELLLEKILIKSMFLFFFLTFFLFAWIRYRNKKSQHNVFAINVLILLIFSHAFSLQSYLLQKEFSLLSCLYKIFFSAMVFKGIFILTKKSPFYEMLLSQERLRRNEVLSSLGEMAAGACHEMRNPLTTIKGFVQLIESKYREGTFVFERDMRFFTIIKGEIEVLNNVLNEFLLFARYKDNIKSFQNVNDVLLEMEPMLKNRSLKEEVALEIKVETVVPKVYIDKNKIKQVMVNIINNAFDACQKGDSIFIRTFLEEDRVCIMVEDSGCGIPTEMIDQVFQPFFSTKGEKKGTGLGLSICHQIIKDNGGEIFISSLQGKGTKVVVKLPFNL